MVTTAELSTLIESAVTRVIEPLLNQHAKALVKIYQRVKNMSQELEQLNTLLKQHNEIQTAVAQSAAGLSNRVKAALELMQAEINRRVDPSELTPVIGQIQSSIQSHTGLKNQLDATLPEKAA